MVEPPRTLVLASASAGRRQTLQAAGVVFDVVPSTVDEMAVRATLSGATPSGIAEALARAKAADVSRRMPHALVMGADQVLALDDSLLSKPRDVAEARKQLVLLRGKTHALHTAVALAERSEAVWSRVETAALTMRCFSDAFLDAYLRAAGERVCASVGAYEIEGRGIQLFERVAGDHFTIVGLPLLPLLRELRGRGAIAA
jgi:septum formation protein